MKVKNWKDREDRREKRKLDRNRIPKDQGANLKSDREIKKKVKAELRSPLKGNKMMWKVRKVRPKNKKIENTTLTSFKFDSIKSLFSYKSFF